MSAQDDLPDWTPATAPKPGAPVNACVSARSNGRTGALEFVAVDPDLLDARSGQTSTPTRELLLVRRQASSSCS